jgi:hypothetical protein
MNHDEHDDEHPGEQGLPGKQEHNREEQEPVEPTRRKPGDADGGGDEAGGESGEGSQSTGNPDSAG